MIGHRFLFAGIVCVVVGLRTRSHDGEALVVAKPFGPLYEGPPIELVLVASGVIWPPQNKPK